MSGRVLVLGDAAADLTFWKAANLPVTNAPVRITRGGTAANTAVALARQDVGVAFAGTIGDDALGRFVREDLAREGVDASGLRTVADRATPQVLYAIDDDGSIWTNAVCPPLLESAVFALREEHVDAAAIGEHAWLHVVGLCLLRAPLRDTALGLMEAARAAGVPVSLDLNLRAMEEVETGAFKLVLERALRSATYVLGSASQEFGYLFPDLPPEEVARRIAQDGPTVVLRMSEHGSAAVTASGTVSAEALPVEVASPVGAGDAFNAGFITALMRGEELEAALRRGNATAALTISRLDEGCPTAAAVEQALMTTSGKEAIR